MEGLPARAALLLLKCASCAASLLRQLRAGDHDGRFEDANASRRAWRDNEWGRLSFAGRAGAIRADQRLIGVARLRGLATENAQHESARLTACGWPWLALRSRRSSFALRSSGAAFALRSSGAAFAWRSGRPAFTLLPSSAAFALRAAFAWWAAFPSQSRLALGALRTDWPRLLACVFFDRTPAGRRALAQCGRGAAQPRCARQRLGNIVDDLLADERVQGKTDPRTPGQCQQPRGPSGHPRAYEENVEGWRPSGLHADDRGRAARRVETRISAGISIGCGHEKKRPDCPLDL